MLSEALALNPLATWLAVAILLLAGGEVLWGKRLDFVTAYRSAAWLMPAAVLAILLFVGLVVAYARSTAIWDHGEVAIAAAAWMFESGHPLYNKLSDAARYSTLYGPTSFYVYGLGEAVLGVSMAVCKAISGAAGVLALLFSHRAFRTLEPGPLRWLATGTATLLLLGHNSAPFLAKADPFLLLLASIALWSAAALPVWPAVVVCGIALGLETNLKINGFLYILPAVAVLWQRTNRIIAAAVIVLSLIVFWLPFLVDARISFADWFQLLTIEARSGFRLRLFWQNVQWALMLCAPMLLAAGDWRAPLANAPVVVGTFLACVGSATVFASKIGSGANHMMPFVPVALYLALASRPKSARDAKNERKRKATILSPVHKLAIASFTASVALMALSESAHIVGFLREAGPLSEKVHRDASNLARQFAGRRVAMGYGTPETQWLSVFRLPLLAAGSPELLNFSSMIGYHGFELSPASYSIVEQKQVDVWLIPHGATPFMVTNFYPPYAPVFDDRFRQAFAANYEKRLNSAAFDVYVAKP